jgi:hypothetical protein
VTELSVPVGMTAALIGLAVSLKTELLLWLLPDSRAVEF